MRITAGNLKEFGLLDEVLPEPLGAAHRDPGGMAEVIRNALASGLDELDRLSMDQLLEQRLARISGYGEYKDA